MTIGMHALRTLGSFRVSLAPDLTVTKKPLDRARLCNWQVLEVEGVEIPNIVLVKVVDNGGDGFIFEVGRFGHVEQRALGTRGGRASLSLAHKRRADLLRKIGWENAIQSRVGIVEIKHTAIGQGRGGGIRPRSTLCSLCSSSRFLVRGRCLGCIILLSFLGALLGGVILGGLALPSVLSQNCDTEHFRKTIGCGDRRHGRLAIMIVKRKALKAISAEVMP